MWVAVLKLHLVLENAREWGGGREGGVEGGGREGYGSYIMIPMLFEIHAGTIRTTSH